MSIRNNIAVILNKKLKDEKVMSQKEFAGKLGVSQPTITKWLNGFNAPDIELVPSVCELLGISLYEFFGVNNPNDLSEEDRVILKKIKENPALREIVNKL